MERPSHRGVALTGWALGVILAVIPRVATAQPGIEPYLLDCLTDPVSAIEDAIYTQGYSYILVPGGDCLINRTIKLTNQEGLRIEGSGRDNTVFVWVGEDEGPMFSIQNSTGVRLAHFGVCVADDPGTPVLISAVDLYNACIDGVTVGGNPDSCSSISAVTGPGSSGNSFVDLEIGGCHGFGSVLKNGIRIKLHPSFDATAGYVCDQDKEADCNNGRHEFTNVQVREFRESAFVVEGQQSRANMFTGCRCSGLIDDAEGANGFNSSCCGGTCVVTGVAGTESTSGHFNWYGGLADSLSDSVFSLGSHPDRVLVSGLQAEKSRMLLRTYVGDEVTTSDVALDAVAFNPEWVHQWDDAVSDSTFTI